MAETKNLLLRLDPGLAAELQAVAEVEGLPVSELVREAIRALVESRRRDKRFQKRLRDAVREHEELLARAQGGQAMTAPSPRSGVVKRSLRPFHNATWPLHKVDEADLVLVGAAAIRSDPEELLARAEVAAVLARIAASVAQASTPTDAVAHVLVEMVRQHPFPDGNAAAAWLNAVHILATNGLGLDMSADDSVALIDRVERQGEGEADVAAVLRRHLHKRRSRFVRAMRWLFVAERPDPGAVLCPHCLRPLPVAAPSGEQRAREPEAPQPQPQWCPVVTASAVDDGPFLAVLLPEGSVLFLPAQGDEGYELFLVPELVASDLVGDWSRLTERGVPLGFADVGSVRFDTSGRMLDRRPLRIEVGAIA